MILMDTHALVWWAADPAEIPGKARRVLDKAGAQPGSLAASCISVWEIAMLVAHGRLQLTMSAEAWLAALESLPALTFVPIDNRIAVRAVSLPDFAHRDPADRFIVATAIELGATLITADRRLRGYRPVTTVWD